MFPAVFTEMAVPLLAAGVGAIGVRLRQRLIVAVHGELVLTGRRAA